jgi:hypothetical protein
VLSAGSMQFPGRTSLKGLVRSPFSSESPI